MTLTNDQHIISAERLEPSASPSWWGADSVRTRVVTADGQSLIDREMHPDACAYSSPCQLVDAARQAAALGVGPEVIASDPRSGEILMKDMRDGWRNATIDDFVDPSRLSDLAHLLATVRTKISSKTQVSTVFDDIRNLLKIVDPENSILPADFTWLRDSTLRLEKWIPFNRTGAVFCHNVGDVSNVLLSEEGMLLVDWDLARRVDPLQEIGIMVDELSYLPVAPEELFAVLSDGASSTDYEVARAYGIAEHLRQALIGVWRDQEEPASLEYTKYSDWHFLHLREALRDVGTDIYFTEFDGVVA